MRASSIAFFLSTFINVKISTFLRFILRRRGKVASSLALLCLLASDAEKRIFVFSLVRAERVCLSVGLRYTQPVESEYSHTHAVSLFHARSFSHIHCHIWVAIWKINKYKLYLVDAIFFYVFCIKRPVLFQRSFWMIKRYILDWYKRLKTNENVFVLLKEVEL